MSYEAIVTKAGTVSKIEGADRIGTIEVAGTNLVVGIDTSPDTLGIYFPSDGCINPDFLSVANLLEKKSDGSKGGGFFDARGRVRAQTFRGVKSDGFWMPLDRLYPWLPDAGVEIVKGWKEGQVANNIGELWLAKKFTLSNPRREAARQGMINQAKKKAVTLLKEHYDTPTLWTSVCNLPAKGRLIVTEKLHGTSQRTGVYHRPVKRTWFETLKDRFLSWWDKSYSVPREWITENGTRRVMFDSRAGNGYRHRLAIEVEQAIISTIRCSVYMGDSNPISGMGVYYEIVGPTIQKGHCYKDSIKDKKLAAQIKKLWPNMTVDFNYGETEPTSYIYRCVFEYKDGTTREAQMSEVYDFCRVNDLKSVREVGECLYSDKAEALRWLRGECDAADCQASLVSATSIMEGLCIRVDPFRADEAGDGSFTKALKYKGFVFKVGEGVAKDKAEAEDSGPDIEEEEAE